MSSTEHRRDFQTPFGAMRAVVGTVCSIEETSKDATLLSIPEITR